MEEIEEDFKKDSEEVSESPPDLPAEVTALRQENLLLRESLRRTVFESCAADVLRKENAVFIPAVIPLLSDNPDLTGADLREYVAAQARSLKLSPDTSFLFRGGAFDGGRVCGILPAESGDDDVCEVSYSALSRRYAV